MGFVEFSKKWKGPVKKWLTGHPQYVGDGRPANIGYFRYIESRGWDTIDKMIGALQNKSFIAPGVYLRIRRDLLTAGEIKRRSDQPSMLQEEDASKYYGHDNEL